MHAGLERILDKGYQLIWQTGKGYEETARKIASGHSGVWTAGFITHMEMAYAAADIVVSRAGSTIAELCVAAKPVVFVPYPYAAEDHQTVNAMSLVRHNAGLLVPDAEARTRLVDVLLELAADQELQRKLKEHISALAIPDADERIAREVLQQINR
jgi:UDP-N-acetylglucosamine--N-acetylmuramyl-(pentapeptide) pyrophosphoryl-undecaprenol N-acetylglucosamine transferase